MQTQLPANYDLFQKWYMDKDTESDQRLPHKANQAPDVSIAKLEHLGVRYYKFDQYDYGQSLDRFRHELRYNYADEVECSPDCMINYDDIIKQFYTEHLHADEEIRFIIEGSGYFDVRDQEDNWIRMQMKPGDLITLPAGMYHRFTLDHDLQDYIKAMRLFSGTPIWTPINRPADNHPARVKYLRNIMQCMGAWA